MPYNYLVTKKLIMEEFGTEMTTLNLTKRQVTILNFALTTLHNEITKSGEGIGMIDEIMELNRYIHKQTLEN